jgi:hypothetical protein
MSKTFLGFVAAIIFSLCSARPSSAQTNGQVQHPAQARVREEPCWQKVGITKEAKEQRDAITHDTHSQVEAVCADSSLTPQQQKQKIHQIRQESKQKVGALIGEQQQEELQACQKERAATHPSSTGMQHGGGGPCGALTSPAGHHAGQAPGGPGEGNQQAAPQE